MVVLATDIENSEKYIDEIDQFCLGGKANRDEGEVNKCKKECCTSCVRCPKNWVMYTILSLIFYFSWIAMGFLLVYLVEGEIKFEGRKVKK